LGEKDAGAVLGPPIPCHLQSAGDCLNPSMQLLLLLGEEHASGFSLLMDNEERDLAGLNFKGSPATV
jgi:hypothetical protein